MAIRKKYIIDKKFQLKTTFSIIGITSIIVAILIAVIVLSITYNNNKLTNIIQIQENVVEALLTYSQDGKNREKKIAIKNVAVGHYNNIETIKKIINYNQTLLIVIIIIGVLQSFLLYVFLIRKTHQISGPLYIISQYIRDIIDGKHPKMRPLRKKDELKELYELFKTMANSLEGRGKTNSD